LSNEKACDLIAEAGRNEARLVVFPESYIPMYPDWVWAVPSGEESLLNVLYAELLANAVDIPGPAAERLGQAARRAHVCVAIGLTERNVEASGMALRKSDIPDRYEFKQHFYTHVEEWINVGDSAIINPDGEIIAGPLREQEGILYAPIDPLQMRGPKWMLDVAGHYARPDVFQLTVHREKRPMVRVHDGETEAGEDITR